MSPSAPSAGQVVYRPVSVGRRRSPLAGWYLGRPVEGVLLFAGLTVAVLVLAVLCGWCGGSFVGAAVLGAGLLVVVAYAAVFLRRVRAARSWERVRLPDPEFQTYRQVVAEVSSLRRGLTRLYARLDADVEDALAQRAWRVAEQLHIHGEVRASLPTGRHLAELDGKLTTLREEEMAAVMAAIHIELDKIKDARTEVDAWMGLVDGGEPGPDDQWEALMDRLRALNLGLRELDRLGLLEHRPPLTHRPPRGGRPPSGDGGA